MSMRQYLARYAEAEVKLLATLEGQWQQALLVPAYKESPDFLDQILPHNALLILVVNRPPDDSDCAWAQLIQRSLPSPVWRHAHLSLHHRVGNSDLLLVDRCLAGAAIPNKQGVGLARKIAADIACQLLSEGKLGSTWLACTDADAVLPADYWEGLMYQPEGAVACLFPFHHSRDSDTATAIRHYELHMLYYVAGLRFAGSPYAWPTIGSCIAMDANAYAQVRGYPKKSGGEDFYLLNKLAKIGGIRHANKPQITLSARLSDRVPFGTGPALQKILRLNDARDFCSYHPESFSYLKAVLAGLRQASLVNTAIAPAEIAAAQQLEPAWLVDLWQDFGCNDAIARARNNSRSAEQTQRQLMTWFDSFRSLKLIHACRRWLPDQALEESVRKANWLTIADNNGASLDQNLDTLQHQLADNQLRGAGIAQTNEARTPEIINISGH